MFQQFALQPNLSRHETLRNRVVFSEKQTLPVDWPA